MVVAVDSHDAKGASVVLDIGGVCFSRITDTDGLNFLKVAGSGASHSNANYSKASHAKLSLQTMNALWTELGPSPDDGLYPDRGWKTLSEELDSGSLDLIPAVGLCEKLAQLVADLHDVQLVSARLSPDTIWVRAEDEVRLAPIQPVREGALLTDRAAFQSGSTSWRDFDNRAAAAEPRQDLEALGALCRLILTGSTSQQSSANDRALRRSDVPEVLLRIADKLMGEGREYETAQGAVHDLQRCMSILADGEGLEMFPLGIQDGAPQLRLTDKFFGRTKELSVLSNMMDRASEGSASILINGAPGVGKTRLVDEFEATAKKRGALVVRGKSDQLNIDQPLLSLSQALSMVVDDILSSHSRLVAVWKKRIKAALGNDASALYPLVPRLRQLVGDVDADRVSPQDQRNQFLFLGVQLIKAFCRPRRPLCMILDDLQWADEATMDWLDRLVSDADLNGFLLIGLYRRGEVAADHPLAVGLKRGNSELYRSEILKIEPLSREHVGSLVASSLELPEEDVAQFADRVNAVAKGNPFFVIQLLKSLNAQEVISFDFAQGRWVWDMEVTRFGQTNLGIADLLISRLDELSEACQKIMMQASVLGASFPEEALRAISSMPDKDYAAALEEAQRETLLATAKSPGKLQFSHDKIQQAFSDWLRSSDLAPDLRDVGSKLVDLAESKGDLALLSIGLSCLNDGPISGSEAECRRFAELNLKSGRDAREKLAFDVATERLKAGLAWLGGNRWKTEPKLARELSLEAFRAAYQARDFEFAEDVYAQLIARIEDPIEQAELISTRVLLETVEHRYKDALAGAQDALKRLGHPIPKRINAASVAIEAFRIWRSMRNRSVDDLRQLPPMTDPAHLKAVQILTNLLPVGYFLDPMILMFSGLRIASISLRHGTSPQTPAGYVVAGLALTGALEKFEAGSEWGQVAADIARREPDLGVRGKALVINGGFVSQWRNPFEVSLDQFEEAYVAAMAAGDLQYAAYALLLRWQFRFFRGAPLEDIYSNIQRYSGFLSERGDVFEVESMRIWDQALRELTGRPTIDEYADGNAFHDYIMGTGHKTLIGYSYAIRCKLMCLQNRPEEAAEYGRKGMDVRRDMPGIITNIDAELYSGVSAAMLLQSGKGGRRARKLLKRAMARIEMRAHHSTENFTAHHLLLIAEAEVVGQTPHKGLGLYDKAIVAADAAGQIDIVGFANRRAAELALTLSLSSQVIEAYESQANRAFKEWGATALVSVQSDEQTKLENSVAHIGSQGAIEHVLAGNLVGDQRFAALLEAAAIDSGFSSGCCLDCSDATPEVILALDRAGSASTVETGSGAPSEHGVRMDLLDHSLRSGRALFLPDIEADARFSGSGAALCVPFGVDGRGGVLFLSHDEPRDLPNDVTRALRLAVAEIQKVIKDGQTQHQLAQAEQKIGELDEMRREIASYLPNTLSVLAERGDTQESERLLVTSMFIDVQSYTTIVESFPSSEVRDRLQTLFSKFFEEILRFEGGLVNTLGDAIFAVFDSPEDDQKHAENAVRAALRIAEIAKQDAECVAEGEPHFIMNIGINSGIADVGFSALDGKTQSRGTVSVIGPSVNIAARVAAEARDGAILIGEETKRLLHGGVDTRSMGKFELKNVGSTVEIFRVNGLGEQS